MKPFVVELIRDLTRRAHLDVVGFDHRTHPLARRMRLLSCYEIDVILDIGANHGQYAREIRRLGYRGRIISFEPLTSAFAELKRNRAKAPYRWEIANLAIGDRPGRAVINIAANSHSSSLLPMLPTHWTSAPKSRFIGQEEVETATLDSVIDARVEQSERLFVKSDTQGYDGVVLAGGSKSMERILGIQVEMSIVPLYQGEMLFMEMVDYLSECGFTLMSLEPGFASPHNGQLLQVDGVFFRA